MKNTPLNSNEHGKILVFSLLMLPFIGFGVGAIPAIFLAFGLYMMKKNQQFSHIETAVLHFKIYTYIALVGLLFFSISFWWFYLTEPQGRSYYQDEVAVFPALTVIAIIYLIALRTLFYRPLLDHSEWVERNGIFSSKATFNNPRKDESEVDIIKGEKRTQYSVADELTKWAKLKEDGHISVEEYNDARAKLLKRS